MNLKIVLPILALLIGIGVYLLHRADQAGAGPAVVVDSISNDLDFKSKADLSLRIGALRDEVKQDQAMGLDDEEHLRADIAKIDDLAKELDALRQQFLKDGKGRQGIDAWVRTTQWPDLQAMGEAMRARLPANAP